MHGTFRWQNLTWDFRAAIIHSWSVRRGHIESLVCVGDEMRLYDDDTVTTMSVLQGLARMRLNKFGLVYGLIYEQRSA